MDARDTSPPNPPPGTGTPAPMWARAAVGALLSLIPSTIIAALIVVVAVAMPLIFPASVGAHSITGTAAFLVACVYGLGVVHGAWRQARRRG